MCPQTQQPNPENIIRLDNKYWILVPGKPASGRAKKKAAKVRRTKYKNAVGTIAAQIFDQPIQGRVQVDIYHFYKSDPIDLDNLAKPILDGLKGVAYNDDRQVQPLHTDRVQLNASTTISGVTSPLIPKALADNKECVIIGIKPFN